DATAHAIATALYKTFPQVWNFTGKSSSLVTEKNFEEILMKFSEFAKITPPVAKAPYPQTEGALRQQNLTPEKPYHIQQAPHIHHQRPHQKRRTREGCSGYQDLERQLEAQNKRMEAQEKQIKALLAQINKGSLGKV
ncbi:hypothetical protein BDF14DRAFT_1872694, partial [Spinellus fusiger]